MLKDPFDKGPATGITVPIVGHGATLGHTSDGPLHCAPPNRAMTAAGLLDRAGHRDVAVLEGPPQSLGPVVTSSP